MLQMKLAIWEWESDMWDGEETNQRPETSPRPDVTLVAYELQSGKPPVYGSGDGISAWTTLECGTFRVYLPERPL